MDAELDNKKVIVDRLRHDGINITSIDNLIKSKATLRAVIPLLVKYLQIDYPSEVKKEIVEILRKYKGPMMVSDHQIMLDNDPEWVRRNAEREAQQKARIAQRLAETDPEHAPVLAELAAAGVKVRMNPKIQLTLPPAERPGETPVAVTSLSDLVNSADSYPEAIPILIKHLRKVRHPIMVNSIARALTVKEARGTDAAGVILDRLKQTEPSATQAGDEYQARWALANALTVVADASMAEEIKILAADAYYQDVHLALKLALKNLASKKSK